MNVLGFVFLTILCYANGDVYQAETCTTPDGYDGECIYYTQCPSILYQIRYARNKDFDFLRRSKCGNEKYHYCCRLVGEPECYTPDGRNGQCLDYRTNKDGLFRGYTSDWLLSSRCLEAGKICYSAEPRITESSDCKNSTAFPPTNVETCCCGVDAMSTEKIFDDETTNQRDTGDWTLFIPTQSNATPTFNSTTEDIDQLRSKMEIVILNLKKDRDFKLDQVTDRLNEIKSQNRAISDSNNYLDKSMDEISSMYEELKTQVDKLVLEHQRAVNQIKTLEMQLEEEFRKRTSMALEIKPIPIQRNENIMRIIDIINYHLSGLLQKEKIVKAYRDKTYGNKSIIVEYQTSYYRDWVLQEFKKLNRNLINQKSMGINNYNKPIYITRLLTPKLHGLHNEARVLVKNYGFRLWIEGEKLYIRKKAEQSPTIEITSHEQIQAIISLQGADNVSHTCGTKSA